MAAHIIDGKALAARYLQEAAESAKGMPRAPMLAAILVGDDPASQTYVRMKEKRFAEAGFQSQVSRLPADATEEQLGAVIREANQAADVDGILVQQPLPKHLSSEQFLSLVDPAKDVDGFHPVNLGRLLAGYDTPFIPCTPLGIMRLLESEGVALEGKRAVVVGRSNIVGKPVALLLLQRHATVTICHTRSKPLGDFTHQADVLIAAAGRARLITGDMVKPGAVVIDVGMNRVEGKLVGDVDFEGAAQVASAIAPVPGGVGPMTIAMLLHNTLVSAQRRLGCS
jgi:methylenetetrahydrofolate dehydrogenase (NADP+)/methenyltetrahydrofolate cyclohydrolase